MSRIIYLLSKLIKKSNLPAIRNSFIHTQSKICSGSHVVNTNIDKYTYVGNFCTIIETDIGKFSSIADNCTIGGASHPIEWVSTSPVFHEGRNILRKNFSTHEFKTSQTTIIGNDVWVGNNCLIKSGISIADGAVIGMGSVVTKNVGPYEIWAGNPARLIKKRFSENVINELIKSKWWELTDNELKELAPYINNYEKFLEVKGRGY